jgi:hypothetical protein
MGSILAMSLQNATKSCCPSLRLGRMKCMIQFMIAAVTGFQTQSHHAVMQQVRVVAHCQVLFSGCQIGQMITATKK